MSPQEPSRHGYDGQRNSDRPIDPEMLRNNISLWLRLVAGCEIEECHTEHCLP